MGSLTCASSNFKHDFLRSMLFTSLFCIVIAVATYFVWGPPIYSHFLISFGYGYSAVIGARVVALVKTNITTRELNLYSVAIAMVFGTLNAYFWVGDYPGNNGMELMKPVVLLGFIFTVTCFVYFYAHEQKIIAERELEKVKREQTEQEKALVLSELKQLQSQIEPHFLFNTLANINALIEQDPTKAQSLLTKLTDLLRATLRKNRQNLASLDQELQLVSAYLGIQQIRLGEGFSFAVDCDPEAADLAVPPLLLQPLVENAVLHGVEPLAERGHIQVVAKLTDQNLNISVIDNGQGFKEAGTSKGHGIGLQNIRARLKALFSAGAGLKIIENEALGVTSEIWISRAELKQLNENQLGKS